MQITIRNLGPIKQGTIDLNKRLTILTGPNNTGKSYLAYLIHGVGQYEKLNGLPESIYAYSKMFASRTNIKKAVINNERINVPNSIRENTDSITTITTEIINNNLVKIFASSSIKPEISINIDAINNVALSVFNDSLYVEDNKLFEVQNDDVSKPTLIDDFSAEKPTPNPIDKIAEALSINASICLDRTLGARSFFFPAERTAINMFAKHIVATKAELKDDLDAEVIAGLSDDELVKRLRAQVASAPKYPYALRDYINFVNTFKPGENESPFAGIAAKMEAILIGGKVQLNDFDQLIFTPIGAKASLELHLSSSLVKSLSYLILYLRYIAKKGDQVIIDEPELNLHPDLQVAITKLLAEMVNAGLKLIISTHSDYLIKELNTLVLLHDLNEHQRHQDFIKKKGYVQSELLDKQRVAAYYIDKGEVRLIDVATTGIVVPTIDKTIDKIDNLAEEIYFKLSEPEPVKPVRKKKA